MYFNLRVEKEGLNAHVLSRDLGGRDVQPLMGDEETGGLNQRGDSTKLY